MEKSSELIGKCDQPGCTVAEDGKCLEGLELTECPHFIRVDSSEQVINDVNLEEKEINVSTDKNVKIYSGEALENENCNEITLKANTNLIMIAGPANSGKTTLITSIFELFQRNSSFAGYIFAGSSTLLGFEKRCHESRISSERTSPDTERTKNSPSPVFLHLIIKDEKCKGEKNNLLFTDISGENFEFLRNSTEQCKKFSILKRIDHFVLLFDSNLLSTKTQRHLAKDSSLSLLRSIIESDMLNININIEIVFSKWDLFSSKKDSNNMDFLNSIKKDIKSRFSSKYKNITFHEIASRPVNPSELDFGYGIDKIFPKWIKESIFLNNLNLNDDPDLKNVIKKEISKYKYNKI